MKKLTAGSIAIATILGTTIFSPTSSFANVIHAWQGNPTVDVIHVTTVKAPKSTPELTVSTTASFGYGSMESCQYYKSFNLGSHTVIKEDRLFLSGPNLSAQLGSGFTCGKLEFEASSLPKTMSDEFNLIWDGAIRQYIKTVPSLSVVDFGANQ